MNIAIVGDSQIEAYSIKKILNRQDWSVDYYKSSIDFSKAQLCNYDVVISSLIHLLQAICIKSPPIEVIFYGEKEFYKKLKNDSRVSGIIDKKCPEKVKIQLEYLESKIVINQALKTDARQLNKVAKKLNVMNGGINGLLTKSCCT